MLIGFECKYSRKSKSELEDYTMVDKRGRLIMSTLKHFRWIILIALTLLAIGASIYAKDKAEEFARSIKERLSYIDNYVIMGIKSGIN